MSPNDETGRPAAGREEAMRATFTADVRDDGSVELPEELLGRLRAHGVRRVEITLGPAGAGRDLLAARGVDDAAVNGVAQAQHVPIVVAESMLLAQGAALDYPALASRLSALRL